MTAEVFQFWVPSISMALLVSLNMEFTVVTLPVSQFSTPVKLTSESQPSNMEARLITRSVARPAPLKLVSPGVMGGEEVRETPSRQADGRIAR